MWKGDTDTAPDQQSSDIRDLNTRLGKLEHSDETVLLKNEYKYLKDNTRVGKSASTLAAKRVILQLEHLDHTENFDPDDLKTRIKESFEKPGPLDIYLQKVQDEDQQESAYVQAKYSRDSQDLEICEFILVLAYTYLLFVLFLFTLPFLCMKPWEAWALSLRCLEWKF